MCDEYDDERMMVLWRTLAERKRLETPSTEEEDEPREPIIVPLQETPPAAARAKPLVR